MSNPFASFEGCPIITVDWSRVHDAMEMDRQLMESYRPRFCRNPSQEEIKMNFVSDGVLIDRTFVQEIKPGVRTRIFSIRMTGDKN